MAISVEIVCWLSCIILAFQDFFFRRIHIGILLLFAGFGYLNAAWIEKDFIPDSLASNLLVVLIIFLVILFFYKGKKGEIIDQKLGKGDIAMWLALACWMQTGQFLLFFCLSTWILCLIFLPLQQLGKIPKNYPIPLAGAQALMFLFFRNLEIFNIGMI